MEWPIVYGDVTGRVSRIVAVILFVLLIAGGFRFELLRLLIPPHRMPPVEGPHSGLRQPLRLRNDRTPEQLRVFLTMARLQIPPGRTVSVVLPAPHDGFSYEYWRANYELSGRPVLLPPKEMHPANADYVAAWKSDWSNPLFDVVWRGSGGMVLKRR